MKKQNILLAIKEKQNFYEKKFSTVFTNEADLNALQVDQRKLNSTLTNILITSAKILNNLNVSKSPRPDKIHPRIMKVGYEITDVLAYLFNTPLQTSIVPSD